MYTYQMIGIADENGRTYKSKYGSYNKDKGFQLNYIALREDISDLLYELFHEDCWKISKPKKMTKEEIETALGYEVDIIDNENADNKSKEYNDLSSCINTIFDDAFLFLKDSYR